MRQVCRTCPGGCALTARSIYCPPHMRCGQRDKRIYCRTSAGGTDRLLCARSRWILGAGAGSPDRCSRRPRTGKNFGRGKRDPLGAGRTGYGTAAGRPGGRWPCEGRAGPSRCTASRSGPPHVRYGRVARPVISLASRTSRGRMRPRWGRGVSVRPGGKTKANSHTDGGGHVVEVVRYRSGWAVRPL